MGQQRDFYYYNILLRSDMSFIYLKTIRSLHTTSFLVFSVRADSAVINNTRNASVSTVASAYPHNVHLYPFTGA